MLCRVRPSSAARFCLVAAGIAASCSATSSKADVEIVDNAPFELADDDSVTTTLVTVRPLAPTSIAGVGMLPRVKLSKQLIIESVRQFPELNARLERHDLDPNEMDLDELRGIILSSNYTEEHLFDRRTISSDKYFPRIAISEYAEDQEYKVWNATAVVNMLATGVIDAGTRSSMYLEGEEIETFGFGEFYQNQIGHIYGSWPLVEQRPIVEQAEYLAKLQEDVRQYDSLAGSILQNIGDITFGRPIVYTSIEKGLVVPNSVRRDLDVCWIDLRVTFRDMDREDIEEMAINYATPTGTQVLELIPLQYTQEFAVTRKTSSPEIGIEYRGAAISLGEFFSQTVAYTHLRPTVVAYGLGERRFSWVIRGDAIRAGSHKFVAIIAVPKGSGSIDIAMSGHVQLTKGFFGGWFDQETIAGTEAEILPISF